MRRGISFNPGSFHYNPPAQETQDRSESSAASSSLAAPGEIAAGAAATDEQLAQLNKAVLDAFIQKAEKHRDNTKLTIDYYRDVLEEVAHFLAQQPQKCSLEDLQRLLSSGNRDDDKRRTEGLITGFIASGRAKITLGRERSSNKLFDVIFPLGQSAHSNGSIRLLFSEISRQAERLIHAYANTLPHRAQISQKKFNEYVGHLRHFAKWLDAKRYNEQPVSDEENSLEKLGSLEKLRVYSDEKSVDKVVARFLQEKQGDSDIPENTRKNIGGAVTSFRNLMRTHESGTSSSRASVSAAAPVVLSSLQRQLLRQFGNEAGPSTSFRTEGMQTEAVVLANNPLQTSDFPVPVSPPISVSTAEPAVGEPDAEGNAAVSPAQSWPLLQLEAEAGQPAPLLQEDWQAAIEAGNAAGEEAKRILSELAPFQQQKLLSDIHAQKIQISPRTKQLILKYKDAAQKEGNKKIKTGTIDNYARHLGHLAEWLDTQRGHEQEIPYELDSLEKLGRHPEDGHVKGVLESFKKNSAAPPSVKWNIQAAVNVLRRIWPRIEAQLGAEQPPPLSQHSPQNVAVTDTALSEEPLAQPHESVPEASGRQADAAQTREVGVVAIEEEQGAFSESEWAAIPFDLEGAAFPNFGNMRFGGNFFDFILDEDGVAFQAAGPGNERLLQPVRTATSQADLPGSSQVELGTTRPREDADPSSSSAAPAPLASPRSKQAALQQRLFGQVGEASRMAQPGSLKRPAPES